MRIAQVCPYSLSQPGGVQSQVLGLARSLSRRGHQVTVIGPADGPVPLFAADVGIVTTGPTVSIEANGSLAPISIRVSSARKALSSVAAGAFEVLHLHEPLVPGPTMACLIACRSPMVATFHLAGTSASYRYLRPVVRHWVTHLALRCCVSDAARQTAEVALGGTYTVLFNGVDIERFERVSRKSRVPGTGGVIAFIGRHEERKGLAVLLDAFRRLRSSTSMETSVLRIAGEGPQTEALTRRYSDVAGIEWLGRIDDDAVASAMAGADIVCAPSLGGESFGIVLVEAMAAGAAVVASDIPGYRAPSAHGAAVLVPPGDPGALAAALEGILTDAARARELIEAGHRRARDFSMEALAGAYEGIYRSLV